MGMSLPSGCRGGSMVEGPLCTLQHLLVCPACKDKLAFSPTLVQCSSCGLQFPQGRNDCFDLLLPHHLLDNKGRRWGERQQEMEEWYEDLIANPAAANSCFANDYAPLASLLAAKPRPIGDNAVEQAEGKELLSPQPSDRSPWSQPPVG